jgi:hypothetical protein
MNTLSDKDALDAIHETLDGKEWEPDFLEFIAHVLAKTGRTVRGPDGLTDEERFPYEDWRNDVWSGDTRLGYAEWVAHNVESEDAP